MICLFKLFMRKKKAEFNGEFDGKKENMIIFGKLYPCEFILNSQGTAIVGWKQR